MRAHSALITVAGAFLTLSCFVLPWVTFTNGGYKRSLETNIQSRKLGSANLRIGRPVTEQGTIIKPIPATHHRHPGYKIALNGNWITIAFIAAITAFISSVVLLIQRIPGKSKKIVFISSGIGLVCLILTIVQVLIINDDGIRQLGNTTYTLPGSLQFGGFATLVGFVIAIIGALLIPKLDTAIDENI